MRSHPVFACALLAAAAVTGSAHAQRYPSPQLLLVTPCGGQAGASFDITVTGQNLDQIEGLYFSVPRVGFESIAVPERPKQTKTPAMKKQKKAPARQSNKFKITLPADARPGIHDIRVITKGGVSNPRAFVVGDLKEVIAIEPNDDVPQSQRIELNCTVNGGIGNPTDVDYFVFTGKKGQRVVFSCLTSSIDSKLPATIEVYDEKGKRLASGRGYRENDAVTDCVLPEGGDYNIRVASFTYTQGGPEHFYRLTVSTAPWIDAIFPAAIEPGRTTEVTVYGRNLPDGKLDPAIRLDGRPLETATVSVTAPGDPLARQRLDYTGHIPPSASSLDGFELRLHNQSGISNPALMTYAAAPLVLDAPDNDSAATAQKVTVPCQISGRLERKNDQDWYVFHAEKGQAYSIELCGDRLGPPLDLYFIVRDGKGRIITEQDDGAEVLSPQFFTRTFDPQRYRLTPATAGDYALLVSSRDASVQAGPRHGYQLRIAPEQPDFRLIAMPAVRIQPPQQTIFPGATVVGQHGTQVIQIYAWRSDGFAGDIELSGKDLPDGLSLPPQTLAAGQKQAQIVLSASADAEPWTGPIRIIGTATIAGRKLIREARPATITWPVPQPNIPAISRLDRSLVVAVRDKAPFSLTADTPAFTAFPGEKITVPLRLTRNWPELKGPIQIAPLTPLPAFNFPNVTLTPGKDTIKASLDVKPAAAPGNYTVILNGQAQGANPQKRNQPGGISQPSTPINVIVLPKQLVKLSVTPANVKVAPGAEVSLVVKAARLYDFEGPVRLRLIIPAGIESLQAEQATLAAGDNQVRLVLTASPDAPSGKINDVVIRASAEFRGRTIVQNVKLVVTVSKEK